jgi:hypothetical protein
LSATNISSTEPVEFNSEHRLTFRIGKPEVDGRLMKERQLGGPEPSFVQLDEVCIRNVWIDTAGGAATTR